MEIKYILVIIMIIVMVGIMIFLVAIAPELEEQFSEEDDYECESYWIIYGKTVKCHNCEKQYSIWDNNKFKFCPNCGCKMTHMKMISKHIE